MAPWRPTVHVWPTLWNTKKIFHPNVQPVQFSSWYLPPFGFYGSLKKCHFSLSWEWFSLFPFSWGGGAPQTPSHIGSFDPLGVRNNQHPKNFFAPEPIFKLSQSAPLKGLGLLSWPLQGPLNSPCGLLPELLGYKDTMKFVTLSVEVPGHCRENKWR